MEENLQNQSVEITAEEAKKKKIRNRILTVIFVLFNIGIILFTAINEFSGDHSSEAKPVFLGFTTVIFMICAVLCLVFALALESVKYKQMGKLLGEPIKTGDAVRTVVMGRYYDCITPSGTGGQPFQIYNLHKAGYSDGTSAALPLGGFFTMQTGFIILGIIVFLTSFGIPISTPIKITAYIGLVSYSLAPTLIVIFAISNKAAIGFVMFFVKILAKIKIIKNIDETSKKVIKYLTDYNESIKKLAKNKFGLIKLLALSLLYQIFICSIPFFVLTALGATLSFYEMLCITVYIYAAVTLIPTPGNSGVAEGSFYLIFSRIDTVGAFWPMIIWRFICYYAIVLVGGIVNIYSAIKNKKKKLPDSEEK